MEQNQYAKALIIREYAAKNFQSMVAKTWVLNNKGLDVYSLRMRADDSIACRIENPFDLLIHHIAHTGVVITDKIIIN
ncbi:MAG: hypothetical protein KKA07_18700 [Bacteroidetes bacterium]|nr:hypothetical protein [Bacteroidota bacterium]MBU1721102.1 hypothetical protein [Bacteroidota bacterium]